MKTIKVIEEGEIAFAKKALKQLGYKTTRPRNKNANGVDIFAIKEDSVLSVEVKIAKPANKGRRVLRVNPVEKNRLEDDLIAIVTPSGYTLIEPMRDHLKCCNRIGQRFLNL